MAKCVGNIAPLHEVARRVGPRRADHVLRRRRTTASRWRSDDDACRRRRRAWRACATPRRLAVDGESPADMRRCRDAFFDALADDFNTAAALAALFDWVSEANARERRSGDADLARCSACWGWRTSLDARPRAPAPRSVELLERAPGRARAEATSPRPTGCATSCAARGWEVRDGAGRARARARRRAPVILYGRNPVREALRAGRRRVQHVWATERRGARAVARRACAIDERRGRARSPSARGSPDHQGVCAEAEPLPVRRRRRAARARRRRSSSRSTSCRTRRTSARSAARAECAGATGLVLPERRVGRGDARGRQGVGGRRRAPADRPRAQPRRLPRRGEGGRRAGATAPTAAARDAPTTSRTTAAASCSSSGAEGRGLRPRVRQLRRARVAAAARPHRIAERQRRGGRAAVRDLAAAAPGLTGLHNRVIRCAHVRVEPEVEHSDNRHHAVGALGGVAPLSTPILPAMRAQERTARGTNLPKSHAQVQVDDASSSPWPSRATAPRTTGSCAATTASSA